MNSFEGLVLSRRCGESILIGDDIELQLVSIGPGQKAKIRIIAPQTTRILRKEKSPKEEAALEPSETET